MSFLRRTDGRFDGKLATFVEGVLDESSPVNGLVVRQGLHVIVLLYVATERALAYLAEELGRVAGDTGIRFTIRSVHMIPEAVALRRADGAPFGNILRSYFVAEVSDEHMAVGGTDGMFGFADGGLPLVLAHNSPNNSVFLLWAQARGRRALFPRVSRHVGTIRGDSREPE
jgi:hypothetical protein